MKKVKTNAQARSHLNLVDWGKMFNDWTNLVCAEVIDHEGTPTKDLEIFWAQLKVQGYTQPSEVQALYQYMRVAAELLGCLEGGHIVDCPIKG